MNVSSFANYSIPPYSFNYTAGQKSHFPLFHFFASIFDRIKNETGPESNVQQTDQSLAADIMILLADDDKDDRELFEEAITEISPHITIRLVEDGFQLMDILKDVNTPVPDILFLDLNMPGMSGKQCLSEIKKDPRLNKLPVVIYSTSSLINDIKDTHSIGANLYIKKPDSFKLAISLIKKVFSIDLENLKAIPNLKNFVLS